MLLAGYLRQDPEWRFLEAGSGTYCKCVTNEHPSSSAQQPATTAITAGRSANGTSLATPLWASSTWVSTGLVDARRRATGRRSTEFYSRYANPTVRAFEEAIAALEGAEDAVAYASGMGALSTTILALCSSGSHIVAQQQLYAGTLAFLQGPCRRFGIDVTFVDISDVDNFRRGVTARTRLALIESVSNPLVEVADIPSIAAALGNVPLLVDNTFATPCLLRPLELGACFAFHSASKYLNGHGDVMLGVMVGERLAIRRMRALTSLLGLNSNPFECWLASRGMRTLPLRIRQASETAAQLAEWLQHQSGISRVYYPGLKDHPTRPLAQKLLKHGCGGMLSPEVGLRWPACSALCIRRFPSLQRWPTLAAHSPTLRKRLISSSRRKSAGPAGLAMGSCGSVWAWRNLPICSAS